MSEVQRGFPVDHHVLQIHKQREKNYDTAILVSAVAFIILASIGMLAHFEPHIFSYLGDSGTSYLASTTLGVAGSIGLVFLLVKIFDYFIKDPRRKRPKINASFQKTPEGKFETSAYAKHTPFQKRFIDNIKKSLADLIATHVIYSGTQEGETLSFSAINVPEEKTAGGMKQTMWGWDVFNAKTLHPTATLYLLTDPAPDPASVNQFSHSFSPRLLATKDDLSDQTVQYALKTAFEQFKQAHPKENVQGVACILKVRGLTYIASQGSCEVIRPQSEDNTIIFANKAFMESITTEDVNEAIATLKDKDLDSPGEIAARLLVAAKEAGQEEPMTIGVLKLPKIVA